MDRLEQYALEFDRMEREHLAQHEPEKNRRRPMTEDERNARVIVAMSLVICALTFVEASVWRYSMLGVAMFPLATGIAGYCPVFSFFGRLLDR